MMRTSFVVLFMAFVATPAYAYRLPPVTITQEEWTTPAEEVLRTYHQPRLYWSTESARHHIKLRPSPPLQFWQTVVDLKQALLSLPTSSSATHFKTELIDAGNIAIDEADQLAKKIIVTLYKISNNYRVIGWPRLNNLAVKLKFRKKGYCYHYVKDLMESLRSETWQAFDISWAEAYGGKTRESNALGLTRHGSPFESGLVIDAWRTGSRPFWTRVQGDRWPWKEWKEWHAEIDNLE